MSIVRFFDWLAAGATRCYLAISLLALVSACTSADEFSARPFEETRKFTGNYQALYARTLVGARKCWSPGAVPGSINSIVLDTQIYSDLGYAEIYSYNSNLVVQPTALLRFERSGSDTLMKVKTTGAMGSHLLRRVAYK